MTELTTRETVVLAEYEQQVERGLSTFLDVGRALLAIRDQRLYRAAHDTFDLYVEDRWPSLGRSHAYRLLDAARVADAMSPIGDTPANEAQARELAPLLDEPERLRETWQQVNEQTGGKPTAAAIRAAVRPEPGAFVKVATTTEEFVAQRDTGEVLSVEDWQHKQTAALDAALEQQLSETEGRFLLNLARGLSACNGLLGLSPERAAETCVPGSDDHAALGGFIKRMEAWLSTYRAASATTNTLRRVK